MSKRYDDRYGRGGYGRDRDNANDRGYVERAGDEMRSWFGDDDAERRRDMDEQRDRQRGGEFREVRGDYRGYSRDDRGFSGDSRNSYGDYRTGTDEHRGSQPDWNRSNWNPTNWDDRAREAVNRGQQNYREHSRDWDREGSVNRDTRGLYGESRMYRPASNWSDDNRTESRQQQGPGWGRGPKGYQRSDARILEDVCDRLMYSDVDAGEIEVRVENGEVTLSGSVRDRGDKRRAEDVAEEVSGVRDVHNNIRVHRGDRGIGQSDTSVSEQPGTVLGVNPTASSTIANNERPKAKT